MSYTQGPLEDLERSAGSARRFSAVGDMITWMEDQLQSLGFGGFYLSDSVPRHAFPCEGRLIALSSAARRDPRIESVLRAVGFDQVVEIYSRVIALDLKLDRVSVAPEPKIFGAKQLVLDFVDDEPLDSDPNRRIINLLTRKPAA